MAIPCPRCGRQYDVTLFQYGRTIDCTCGARVGRAIEQRVASTASPPRFFCDAMLGRLARWLRVLDYDTEYDPDIEDEYLVRRAIEECRTILTRDRALPDEWRIGQSCVVIKAEDAMGQLREVVRVLDLERPHALFRRCLECNAPLSGASPEEVGDRVPPRVRATHDRFHRCPVCRRIYWEGDHTRRMRRRVDAVFGS